MNRPCCGQPSRRRPVEREKLPPNPKVERGVAVIYLGAGYVHFHAPSTGLDYHASDHNRRLKVHRDDVKDVLRDRAFILAP